MRDSVRYTVFSTIHQLITGLKSKSTLFQSHGGTPPRKIDLKPHPNLPLILGFYISSFKIQICFWSGLALPGLKCSGYAMLHHIILFNQARLNLVHAVTYMSKVNQGIFSPALGTKFRLHSQSKIAIFFPQYHFCFSQIKKSNKKRYGIKCHINELGFSR